MGWLRRLFGGGGHGLAELARRLGMTEADLAAITPRYDRFHIDKRRGGRRTILAPDAPLKAVQRRMLRRVLALLVSHPAAHGFERGRSIVTNARIHAGRAVVVRADVRDFFATTRADRVEAFLRRVGWDRVAAARITTLCTHDGGLPQGAPTSPRLANLVNYGLDARLHGLATACHASYTRYADDLTFSFAEDPGGGRVRTLLYHVAAILRDHGYVLHGRKTSVRRRHQRQQVTGLVVNDGTARLPREMRRRLRAIEHRLRVRGEATLDPAQVAGWRAYRRMVEDQSA